MSFDLQDKPCSPEGTCVDGYVCLEDRCVPEGSSGIEETCFSDAFCARGLVCGGYLCHIGCSNPYASTRSCGTDAFCAAAASPSVDVNEVAVCLPNCATDPSSCKSLDPAWTCLEMDTDISLCAEPCNVTCGAETCTDACDRTDPLDMRACQPSGPLGTLVCLTTGERVHGQTCDMLTTHCATGYACVKPPNSTIGLCLAYCSPNAEAPCARRIDPRTGAAASCQTMSGSYSVCGALPESVIPADADYTGLPLGVSPPQCVETCGTSDACAEGFRCNDGRCEAAACTTSAGCLPAQSGWDKVCSSNGGCGSTQACVSASVDGYCAELAADGCGAGLVASTLPLRSSADGATADVCASDKTFCYQGLCIAPCLDDAACSAQEPGTPRCDATSGHCVCRDDNDCIASSLGFTRCSDGVCVCATHAECAAAGWTTCLDGRCGCSERTQCQGSTAGRLCGDNGYCSCDDPDDCQGMMQHPNTTWSCQIAP